MKVVKRDGSSAYLDTSKIHKMIAAACNNIDNVRVETVEKFTHINFYDGITTDEIQNILIRNTADLINPRTPNYQYVAGRLLLFSLRKQVWKGLEPINLLEQVRQNISRGFYQQDLEALYSEDEWHIINSYINYDRDLDFNYAAIKQICDKYLIKNRVTEEFYETPQVMYILIAAILFSNYPKDIRLQYVKDYYDAISTHKINLATPILAGVRSTVKQYSSCVLIKAADSLNSIFSANSAMGIYIAKKAGIGLDVGSIRALGASIRGGEAEHTGGVGFIKVFESTLSSCSQGSLRKGSATLFYPIWHKDVESFLVLKNNRGLEHERARKLDYGVSVSKLFYERFLQEEDISLFDPNDVKDLYDCYGMPEFDDLYLKYEQDLTIPRKVISSVELFLSLIDERADTGRIYILNIDHFNQHSSFNVHLSQSNLCVAPETKILTSNGYEIIANLQDKEVEVWNGEEWSKTTVIKTSENSELIKVYINHFEFIECTPYHKFYIVTRYHHKNDSNSYIKEVKASELKTGDRLIKFDLPIIEGKEEFINAYVKGVYTGDGSQDDNKAFVDLYGKKKLLIKHLPILKAKAQDEQDRIRVYLKEITPEDKFVVPGCKYTINSRIQWLAGLIDTDGHIVKNGTNCGIQIASVNLEFLKELKLMLQTLGVNSKILLNRIAGLNLMPNGKGGSDYYQCKECYRLQISSNGFQTLLGLGLKDYIYNHEFDSNIPNREASRYSVITKIENNNRIDSTYCFTEPLKHMGMFNGFLTGQCMEIGLPTKSFESLDDVKGEIATCILSAINMGKINHYTELEPICNLAVRALDNIVDLQEYPFVMAELSAKQRRNIGIGWTNFAYYLAKNNYKWDSDKGRKAIHEMTESLQYYCLKASNNIAKEQGACAKFNDTKYSKGVLPVDTYNKNIDEFASFELIHNWDKLRQDIAVYGLRNSTLTAQMPCEASSLSSNSTNGIEPPREAYQIKTSKSGSINSLVPDFNKYEYEYLWEFTSNEPYLKMVAIMTKFLDQSISANTSYNPLLWDGKVPIDVVIKDILLAYKWGIKTLYYHQTNDMNVDNTITDCKVCSV